MFNDFLLQNFRWRQIIQVIEAVILEPENIQAGFISCNKFVVAKVFEAFRLGSLVPVIRVIAVNEFLKILKFQWASLEREMLIGAQVINDATGLRSMNKT